MTKPIDKDVLVGHHKDIPIHLQAGRYPRFYLPEDFDGEEHWFASFDEATKAIDAAETAKAKLKLKGVKFRRVLLNDDGERFIMTGLNRATGEPMGEGKVTFEAFPDLPWVEETLRERAKLAGQLAVLNKKIKDLSRRIKVWGRISAESYERRLEDIGQNLDEAMADAKHRTPKS